MINAILCTTILFFLICILTLLYYNLNEIKSLIKNAENDKRVYPEYQPYQTSQQNIIVADDSVQVYDRSKLYDAQVNPNRRTNYYELPTATFKQNIDIATRGYPDTYILIGLLISVPKKLRLDKDTNKNKKNKKDKKEKKNKKDKHDIELTHEKRVVLKLFSRQEYPYSRRYEYYALDDNYGNYIKYPIEVRGDEIYDGDVIPVIGYDTLFNVQLYKYDMPRYFPTIF